jgi:hypothetical protein
MELDEALCPRGFEAYVPGLAAIRVIAWPYLAAVIRHALELADYVGLERTLALSVSDFLELRQRIPGDLWRRCAAISRPLLPFPSSGDQPLLQRSDGTPLALDDIVAAVSDALAAQRELTM